jgi:uncharacterized protein DUF2505
MPTRPTDNVTRMKIQSTADYPVSPEQVFAMLTDEDFQGQKCVATGASSHDVSVASTGGRTVVTVKRQMSTEGLDLPSFINLGSTLPIEEVYDWGPASGDGSRSGTIRVSLAGLPLQLNGALALAPAGSGTAQTTDADLKCPVPFFGSKVEEMAAPAIRSALEVEARVGKEWLSTH